MPDNYYRPDDPTQPARYTPPPPGSNQGPASQGKLVIGGFQNQAKPPRSPYKYSPPPAMSAPAGEPAIHHQRYQTPEQLAKAYTPSQSQRPRRRRGCLV